MLSLATGALLAMTTLFAGPAPAHAQSTGPYAVELRETAMVPMPDGVRLATDLWFPVGAEGPFPVVLLRTPYDKRVLGVSEARLYASHGYVAAMQDVRGKYESEGRYVVQLPDAEDGDATVRWLAAQPWSTGRVGTAGCSYLGEAQIFLAKERNPAHAAMIPRAAGGAGRYLSLYNGGAFELALAFGWLREYGNLVHLVPTPGTPDALIEAARPYLPRGSAVPEIDYREAWRTLPLVDAMARAQAPPTTFEDFITHAPDDPWWDRYGLFEDDDVVDVPALHVNSWYDYGLDQTVRYFERMSETAASAEARDNQFLIISPTAHCGSERATENTIVGARPVGDARRDLTGLYVRWFDRWLKGEANGVTDMPRVQYYRIGASGSGSGSGGGASGVGVGEWRAADGWPIPGTRFTEYFLHSGGAANSRFGDGLLSASPPGDEPPDRFTYDPATPVPSVGGPLCCTGSPDAPEGAYDQRQVEMRQDVLVYQTPVLETGLEVTGPLELVLYVASSARDTDFTAKLVDVYPDGTAYNVQEGILRARYREGYDRQVLMEPGEVVELRMALPPVGNYFGAGHRIRLEVSSSNFPRFDRNLNTGGRNWDEETWIVAENVVHHSAEHPSRLVLPIVPNGATRPLESRYR